MEYLHDTVIYKLLAVQNKLVQSVKKDFVGVDITHENYITLHFIYENPGISQIDLSMINEKDKNVIVKSIDRLERNGLVERRKDASDRRVYALHVTEKGEQVIDKYWESLVSRQEAALTPLTEAEKKQFDGLLGKILKG